MLDDSDQYLSTHDLYSIERSVHILIVYFRNGEAQFHTHYPFQHVVNAHISSYKNHIKSHINLFPDKFKNMAGSALTVSAFEHPPAVLYKFENNEIVERLGIDMKLIEVLADNLNFHAKYFELKTGHLWGFALPNGTWTGLVGELLSERVDFAMSNFFISLMMNPYVQYSQAYNFDQGCIAAPAPKSLPRWISPVLPFSIETWIYFVIAYFVGVMILFVINYGGIRRETKNFHSWSYDFLYVLRLFTVNSPDVRPQSDPLRIYIGFLWLFATLMTIAYSANLIAFLSVIPKSSPIDTFKQLRESSLRIGGVTFWQEAFRLSPDKDAQSFVDRFEPRTDLASVLDLVESGEFSLVESTNYLELYVAGRYTYGKTATVSILKQCLTTFNVGIALQKFSPLVENVGHVILRVVEAGLTQKWKDEVITEFRSRSRKQGKLKAEPDIRIQPLSTEHLLGAFALFIISVSVSFIIFIGEFVYHQFAIQNRA